MTPFPEQIPLPQAVPHILHDVGEIAGFVQSIASTGDALHVLERGYTFSDDPAFHAYMENISRLFFNPLKISANVVQDFLILIKPGNTAYVYTTGLFPAFTFRANVILRYENYYI